MLEKFKKAASSRSGIVLQIILMGLWGAQLINSDSYYVNYVLLLVVTGICSYKNYKAQEFLFGNNKGRFCEVIIFVFSFLFSCMVTFANYRIWALSDISEDFGFGFMALYQEFLAITFLAGSFIAFWNVFNAISSNMGKMFWKQGTEYRTKPVRVFFVCFVLLVLSRFIVLWYCLYPGVLSPDSMSQINQILTGSYSNHHPFYHTMVIKVFVTIGLRLFGDINAAVATYSVFQIVFTATCFSLAVSTMAWMKAPRWMIVSSVLFFLLMPYHIIYAITVWKDVMFGCVVLLLITFFYRCMNGIGNTVFNYIVVAFSSVGTCLFRSNGFFAFVILTLAFVVLWKKKLIKMLVIFASVIVLSFIFKHALLNNLGVTQPDAIESLSIPAQQIARVVYEGYELNDWERDLLNEIIDIDQINDNYTPYIADPIKGLVREKGNINILSDRKADYIKLYLTLGAKCPKAYIMGWIDVTRGYWNAGYDYWCWCYGVNENSLGLERTIRSESLDRSLREYTWLFTNVQAFRLFLSIGLFVWIDMLLLMIALLRKDKVGVFASLPILVIVLSLLVATPVFAEYRYIYAAFCALPMVVVIALRTIKDERIDNKA